MPHEPGRLVLATTAYAETTINALFMAQAAYSEADVRAANRELAQAIAANSMLMRVASIGGPLLGGLLYALGGGELTYAICCACFVLGVALLLRVVVAHATAPGPAQGTMLERFGAGITFIRTRPIILGTISLDLFAVLLGGVVALLPIYAQEVLHVGPAGLGALRSAMAVGEVSAGLYLSMRPFNRRVGRTMFIAVAVFGVANLVFALSTLFWLSFAALLVAGAFFMEFLDGTVIATALPDMARDFGVTAVELNIGISAYLITLAVLIPASGWIADRFGARAIFTLALAIFTLASVFCGLSTEVHTFVAMRILQGIGGALMVPVATLPAAAIMRLTTWYLPRSRDISRVVGDSRRADRAHTGWASSMRSTPSRRRGTSLSQAGSASSAR